MNVLNVQNEGLGGAGLDQQLRDLQDAGGKPAQQFNRAELAAGIADLTKQGLTKLSPSRWWPPATSWPVPRARSSPPATTLLLANLRQFGKDGEDAANSAAHFGDVLAKGSLLAASGAKELQQGLAVVGPVADKADLSLEETTAYLDGAGQHRAQGQHQSVPTPSARCCWPCCSPSGKAREEIKKLGVELKNQDGSARDVRDVLIDLRAAALKSGEGYDSATKAALSQADSVSAVASIFRSRGVVGFLNMTGAVDKYLGSLNEANGSLDTYADKLTEGPAKAQERLKKGLDDLALSFAQTFGDKLTSGLNGVSQFFRDMDALTQNKDVIAAYFKAVITGIGGVTAGPDPQQRGGQRPAGGQQLVGLRHALAGHGGGRAVCQSGGWIKGTGPRNRAEHLRKRREPHPRLHHGPERRSDCRWGRPGWCGAAGGWRGRVLAEDSRRHPEDPGRDRRRVKTNPSSRPWRRLLNTARPETPSACRKHKVLLAFDALQHAQAG